MLGLIPKEAPRCLLAAGLYQAVVPPPSHADPTPVFGLIREAELSNQRCVAQLSANSAGVIAEIILWDISPQVAYSHPCVTVLFSDIVGFTTLSTTLTPEVRSFA